MVKILFFDDPLHLHLHVHLHVHCQYEITMHALTISYNRTTGGLIRQLLTIVCNGFQWCTNGRVKRKLYELSLMPPTEPWLSVNRGKLFNNNGDDIFIMYNRVVSLCLNEFQ